MSILTEIEKVLKAILPVLRSSAEKAVAKLPENERNQAIQISKVVEVLKDGVKEKKAIGDIVTDLNPISDDKTILNYLNQWLLSNGYTNEDNLVNAVTAVINHADKLTDTGLKSFCQSFMNTVSNLVAGIDWEALALGVAEAIYNLYVKK